MKHHPENVSFITQTQMQDICEKSLGNKIAWRGSTSVLTGFDNS